MGVIKLGFLHTALHAGCASAVARVIEAHGFEIDYVDLTRGDVKDALFTNQLDIYASTWLPMDDDLLNGNYRAVGDLYQPLPSWLTVGDVTVGKVEPSRVMRFTQRSQSVIFTPTRYSFQTHVA